MDITIGISIHHSVAHDHIEFCFSFLIFQLNQRRVKFDVTVQIVGVDGVTNAPLKEKMKIASSATQTFVMAHLNVYQQQLLLLLRSSPSYL